MTDQKPLLSVIIPVYGTEKYLRKCIDSVLGQSYQNIEIVLVNDCSPDHSKEIIQEYLKKDARIQYVENEKNMGLFLTRLKGFKHSHGEYIASLDSDDYVGVDYYRLLMEDAVAKQADITVSSVVIAVARDEADIDSIESYRCRTMGDFGMRNIDLSGKDILNAFLETECFSSHWWIGCCKLYSRRIWEKSLPILEKLDAKQIMLEDLIFGVIFMSLAERYISCDSETYFYLKHPNSSSMDNGDYSKFESNIRDISNALQFLENYLRTLEIGEDKITKFSNMRKIMRRTWGAMVFESQFTMEEKEELYGLLNAVSMEETSNVPLPEDRYCYLLDTPFDLRFNNIKKEIQKSQYSYISFDIFDTLIVRPFFKPSDLFSLLNHIYNELIPEKTFVDFATLRISAERMAREQLPNRFPQFEEITLDEIYQVIEKEYGIPREISEAIKNKEIELEKRYCYARDKVKEIYAFALACGKKVVCISDMYLSDSHVRYILEKNGYDIKNLFLSSRYRMTKKSGNLYKKVLEELGIEANEIFHMGDNWDSDVIAAREAGICAWLLPKATELLENRVPDIEKKKLRGRFWNLLNGNLPGNHINFSTAFQHVGIRSMLAVVANKYFSNPFRSYSPRTDFNRDPYYMGYFALGMHDFGIAMWLKEEVRKKQNRCVHFVARDGYAVKQVYDVLREKDPDMPESNYFYMSRKSLLPLAITCRESFYSLHRYITLKGCTIRFMLTLLHPVLKQMDEVEDIFFQKGFFMNQPLKEPEITKALQIIANELFDEERMRTYRNDMKEYFSMQIQPGDAMFDIGYSGRAQALLSHLLGYHIDAYYIHSINDDVALFQLEGDFTVKTFFDYTPSVIGRMRELIQMEPMGSCIGYRKTERGIEPVLEENRLSYPAQMVIRMMHKGVTDFATDMVDIFGEDLPFLDWRYTDSACVHEMFLSNPSPGDMAVFRIFYFEDELFFGKNYIKRDMVTLWKEDLRKKNMAGGTQTAAQPVRDKSANVESAGEEKKGMLEIPKASIPVTSDKIDLVHISERQRGGYYFLFDRRKFHRWLENQCGSPVKRLLLYKPYMGLKAMKDKVKHKDILYVAISSYNILCCILHKQTYCAEKRAVLLLSDWRASLAGNIRQSGIFSDVVLMPDIRLREITKNMNREFMDSGDLEKRKKAEEFMQIYEEALPLDVFSFARIVLCNDTMPIGSYLCENKVKYDFIEDGNGIFSDNTLLRENVEKITPLVERYFIDKHHILQHSDFVKNFYVNYNAQAVNHFSSNVHDFNTVHLLEKQKGEVLNAILQIYGARLKQDAGEENCALILTYPLAQRLGITYGEQYMFYALVMDIFAHNKSIHLKPHPDDRGDYAGFEDVKVIPKAVLSELLWYVTKTKYDMAINAVSTSMGALQNYREGISLSREFVEEKQNLFLYYAVALLIKSVMEVDKEAVIVYESEGIEDIFSFFLNHSIYGTDKVHCRMSGQRKRIRIKRTEEGMALRIGSCEARGSIAEKQERYRVLVYGEISCEYRIIAESDCKLDIFYNAVDCPKSRVSFRVEKEKTQYEETQ